MGHGVAQVFTVSIPSGTSLSKVVDLGRSFTKVYVDNTSAAAETQFRAAPSSLGTFRVILDSSGSTFTVGSAASGALSEAPAGFRYMKVETTAAVADGTTVKLYGAD